VLSAESVESGAREAELAAQELLRIERELDGVPVEVVSARARVFVCSSS
jgi:hypothetical protein